MGCSSSRINVSCVEAAIINGENLLLYYSRDIEDISKLIQTNSKEGKVSKKNWGVIEKELGTVSEESQQAKVKAFYNGIKIEKGFKLSTLITLAVLLCKGSSANKAAALFDAHDSKKLGQLSKPDVEAMIDELIEFASVKLPTLASPSDTSNSYTEEEMKTYIEKINQGKAKDREELINGVSASQEMVQKSVFVAWFDKNHKWLGSTDLRTHLKKTAKHEKGDKAGKAEKAENPEKAEKAEKVEKAEKKDKGAEKHKEHAEGTGEKSKKKHEEAPEGS
ncbi:hypothetical protein SteCoe_22881 [Stentor coeruleus]|uniref:EF-hand domain-containing protein n=1 Tax=Stentor coeruleus TaxID=5963 RepID=A0A1R2BL90_9CILI|nr:hypothetical protein SteCoe_22881 [Stentor coeruleus]